MEKLRKKQRDKIAARLLTTPQAAAYLGVSIRVVEQYRNRGLIRCTEMPSVSGTRPFTRYDMKDLDAFIDQLNNKVGANG